MPFRYFIFLCGAACATAQNTPRATGAEPLTLPQALSAALLKNPALQAHAFESRIAEARALQAGLRSNPEISAGLENVLGTGALSGVKGLETTLQLSQVIDLGGHITRRREVASTERALVDVDYQARRVEVLAEVARRFTEVAVDEVRWTVAIRARELAEQTVSAVRVRVEAAKVSVIELNKARTALSLLKLDEEHAEHELLSHRRSLAAALGESEPTFGKVSADLLTLPAVPEFNSLAERIEQSPALARFAVEARWREAQVQLAISLRRSSTRVSAGIRRVENTDDLGFVAGFSMALPIHDKNQGGIREARERRAQIATSAEAVRLEMRATLFDVYQEMLHARTALNALRQEIIPTAEETLALAEKGYRESRYSLLELLDAQRTVIELRRDLVNNAAIYHLHVIDLERLLGSALHGK